MQRRGAAGASTGLLGRGVWCGWIALVFAFFLRTQARADGLRTIPIVFHVVHDGAGKAVADDAFLDAEIARANEIYQPLAIRFERVSEERLPARHAVLNTRADRDALFPYVRPFAVHCMVVATLMDVDEPGRERRGVHWVKRGAMRPHLVVLSAISGPNVLAHELGHYLGVRQHSDVHANIMSYDWGEGVPVFDAVQIARIHQVAELMHTRHEL